MKIFVSRKSAGDLEKCTLECHQGVSAHPAIHCVGDILWIPLGEGKIDPRCILEDWRGSCWMGAPIICRIFANGGKY